MLLKMSNTKGGFPFREILVFIEGWWESTLYYCYPDGRLLFAHVEVGDDQQGRAYQCKVYNPVLGTALYSWDNYINVIGGINMQTSLGYQH